MRWLPTSATHVAARARSRAILLAFCLSAWSPLVATRCAVAETPAQFDAQSLQSVAEPVAQQLMLGILKKANGASLGVAVQPVTPDSIVDPEALAQMNGAIEQALKRESGPNIEIFERASLPAVLHAEHEFQSDAEDSRQLRDARADIYVIGTPLRVPAGYQLTYKAIDGRLGQHNADVAEATTSFIPASFFAPPCRPLDEVVRDAARETVGRIIRNHRYAGREPQWDAAGEPTPYRDSLAQDFIDKANDDWEQAVRRTAGPQPLNSEPAMAAPLPMKLALSVANTGACVTITFLSESDPASGLRIQRVKTILRSTIMGELEPPRAPVEVVTAPPKPVMIAVVPPKLPPIPPYSAPTPAPVVDRDTLERRGEAARGRGDFAGAVQLFQQAANMGSARAMTQLGRMYNAGNPSVAKNPAKAMNLFLMAAKAGDMEAATELGFMFKFGTAGVVDKPQARFWFEKAAPHDPLAQTELGHL